MAKEIKMPQLSEDADSGTIVEILVKEGDRIEEEQSVVAVESDKASVEVPASEAGTVQEIKVSEGDELKVGDVILTLSDENGSAASADTDEEPDADETSDREETEASSDTDSKSEEAAEDEPDEEEAAAETEDEPEAEADSSEEEPESQPDAPEEKTKQRDDSSEAKDESAGEKSESRPSSEIPVAPLARRIARERGVDLARVEGSGPGGRVTADDVRTYGDDDASREPREAPASPAAPALPDFSQWGPVQREKISSIRRVTAQSMAQAWNTVPHVTQFDQADITELASRNESYAAQAEKAGGKLTPTATLLKVTVAALRKFPKFNASLDMENEELIFKQYYHIGVAVDTENGLLVPVIRDVDRQSVVDLSVALPALAQQARDGKLSGDQMQGGTFTLSNLGSIGGTQFTPIVYHPQVAILGVSRSQPQPVWNGDHFEPRTLLPLSLSYDHRVIDGAEAARFLRWICHALEDPFAALMG